GLNVRASKVSRSNFSLVSSLGTTRFQFPFFFDQLAEIKSQMPISEASPAEGGGTHSRKSSRQMVVASPGRSGGSSGKNTHIRKTRSAQMKFELDDVGSGAALSRASSASLGFSFSFTGFTMPPDEVADSRPFSDDDIPEDIEAGTRMTTSTEEKDILNGISGAVNPGEVLALMGPSGSGKTTLLSLLGGRLTVPSAGGSITYNDQPHSKFLKSRIGFVTQDDVLFPHLTVKETLTYAALLRLPKTLTKQEKEKRAADVIRELGLERCQDTMIGGSFVRGVSGGERKRVCIGNEIIINPSVLLFHKFDKLILLGKGSLLYFGKASEAMVYFSSIGCSPMIAMNPAEFLLDLANGNMNEVSVPSELADRVQLGNSQRETKNGKPTPAVVHDYLVEAYETRVAEETKKELMIPTPLDEEIKSSVQTMKREWGASWREQYSILFWRGLKERQHDYFSWLRITQVLVTAERAADMYRLSAYFMARTTSDLPLDLFLPMLFLVVVYFMAGLRQTVDSFFLTMVIVFLCIVAAQDVPIFISWLRYLSFNYHTYRLLLKVQYETISPVIDGIRLDSGLKEATALAIMVFGYRLLAYISLRRMKVG
ncbi:hypothetical protein Ccrd_021705, partial [Cynara cardunculus var. scolymus]